MPKVWNIGNTTVRNPKRIESALKVYAEEGFSGNAKGSIREQQLHHKLKEEKVLDYEGESSDWNGRKWRAAFYQLGFISYEKYKVGEESFEVEDFFKLIGQPNIRNAYELTQAGKSLISAASVPEIEDIYLRQFICYELPSSLETGFPVGKLKPFILFLQVLNILQDKGQQGLNKFETGLFIQKFRDHTPDLPLQIVDEILDYRKKLEQCNSPKEIKALREFYLQELGQAVGIAPGSVTTDYADTTFRYFLLSGVLTRDLDRVVVRNHRRAFVKKILEKEPRFIFSNSPSEYFKSFYGNSTPIPTDSTDFALDEIRILKNAIKDKNNQLQIIANSLTPLSDIALLQKVRYQLIEYTNWTREEDYANEQKSTEAISNILDYLKTLGEVAPQKRVEIDDKPAFLEWAVWRSFLAINDIKSPIHSTRRFSIDQDFLPRNTAPGGGPDLFFIFDSYALSVEVTLTKSHRQMAVESEPVRRHLVDYKKKYPDKEIYCLYIAPLLDNNVTEVFRWGVWYEQDLEHTVNIIPMTIADFVKVIEILDKVRYHNEDFRNLLDRCLTKRNERTPQWKQNISKEINSWLGRLDNK